MQFIVDVLANIVADVIFLLIGIAAAYAWLQVGRRRLSRFFGINSRRRRVVVYYSLLDIRDPGSALDFRGQPRTFTGATIPVNELHLAPLFSALFSAGGLRDQSLTRGIASYLLLRDVSVEFQPSPCTEAQLPRDAVLVCLGSPGYNFASEYYLDRFQPFLHFVHDNLQIAVARGRDAGSVVESSRDLALLVKLIDAERNNVAFVAAGLGVNGTHGAARYLCNAWRALEGDHGDSEFGVCLDFPWTTQDPHGYMWPTVVRNLPERTRDNLDG